jgi:hypothetical protein
MKHDDGATSRLLHAGTIFLGAFLLFQVQPIVAKAILPVFGGAPSVWTTCLLFFQTLLLVGYAWAHACTRWFGPRCQGAIHLGLLAVALFGLPIEPATGESPDPAAAPVLVILSRLIRSVAAPYVALCASAPLLQAWFAAARTGRAPYRLFALSNAGSMLALLSYPFVVEPWLTIRSQEIVWSWAFGCFALLCALCVRERWNASDESASQATPIAAATRGAATGDAPGQRSRLLWLALSACASTLLLAVTNQICQEIAVVPLLWVLPLGLYLLSFMLCFESERWYSRSWCLPLLVLTLAVMAQAATLGARAGIAYALPVDSIGLFVCCMFCHGELAARRPPPRHLTSFFLHVALGGALGGVFVSLLAPMLFAGFDELYVGLLACGALALAIAASCPCLPLARSRPSASARTRARARRGGHWSVARRAADEPDATGIQRAAQFLRDPARPGLTCAGRRGTRALLDARRYAPRSTVSRYRTAHAADHVLRVHQRDRHPAR